MTSFPPPPAPPPPSPPAPPPHPALLPQHPLSHHPLWKHSNSEQIESYSDDDYHSILQREIAPLLQSRSSELPPHCRFFVPKYVAGGILQEGPCCGIVALHLALAQIDINSRKSGGDRVSEASYESAVVVATVEQILDTAKSKNYTSFGEMFSCENTMTLFQHFLPTADKVVSKCSLLRDDALNKSAVIQHFKDGGLILVPYDKDHDFRPCTKRGSKAHWALLLGLVEVTFGKETENRECEGSSIDEGDAIASGGETEKHHFVAARQGKSKNVTFWNLDRLLESNAQLVDYDWEKLSPDESLKPIIPEGGVEEGLKKKMIFIRF